ncbi:MAG: hypothetical protein RIR11_5017 [Bacteroidota bacterium]|jgi:signal transduction histidine kinase/ligand-binding sensor domain-containing protein
MGVLANNLLSIKRLLFCLFRISVLVLVVTSYAFGQKSTRIFEQIDNNRNGKIHIPSAIMDLLIDHLDRLWYATQGQGVVCYDGYNYTFYQYDIRDTNSLSYNRVFKITEDSKKRIWATTTVGLDRIDLRTGKVKRFALPKSMISIHATLELEPHTYLVGSGNGLWELNDQTGTWTHWESANLQEAPIVNFLKDASGQIWASSPKGLIQLNTAQKTYQIIATTFGNPAVPLNVSCLLQDEHDQIWVGSSAGLLRFYPETQQLATTNLVDSLGIYPVRSLAQDNEGTIWIGYNNHGLARWNPNRSTVLEHHVFDMQQKDGIISNRITGLRNDRFGNLWIGTGIGVNKINTRPPSFEYFRFAPPSPKSRWRMMWSTEDEQGGILLNNINGAFYAPKLGEEPIKIFLPPSKSRIFSEHRVRLTPQGQVLICWNENGVGIWQPDKRQVKPFLPDTIFGGNPINGLCFDRQEPRLLWMSVGASVVSYHLDSHQRIWYNLEGKLGKKCRVEELLDDGKGGLWIDCALGVGYLDKKTNRFLFSQHDDKNPEQSLVSNDLMDMSVASDGSVWVATTAGVSHISRLDTHFVFQNYSIKDMPTPNIVSTIDAVTDGKVWIGCMEEITLLNPTTGQITVFNIGNLVFSGMTLRKAFTRTRSGMILVSVEDGLVRFDPNNVSLDYKVPRALITQILVNNKPLQGITTRPEFVENFTLTSDNNGVIFEFVGVHTEAPLFNQYAYQLEGYDTNWVYTNDIRRATYTNLPPGNYRFKVKAANSNGIWNDQVAAVKFIIMPPYWQRQWFRFLMLIVLSVVVYAIFFNQEQKRKLAQEKVLAEQSARYKSQFLANMSHEIRTPMNAVLGMSHLLEDTSLDTQQTKYVGSIKHSAEDLLRIINDILDYSKIESGQFTFQRKPVHLKELLGHVEQSFAYRAMDKSLAFAIVIDPKLPEMIWADPVRLSQILSNLISNAIKFTEKGSITVAVNAPNPPSPQFQITVQDTGIGIPAENLDSIFESFNQVDEAYATSLGGTGLGLAIARQLANQQGGSIQVDSAVGVGTIFTVYLPLIEVEKTVKLKDDTQQVAQSPLSGIKILLVEDVYFNQLLATEMLKKHIEAVHIDLAENGQIALEMVQAAEYDLVLMDVKMPVMDGYTAARLIRTLPGAYYAQLPILALTANAIPEQVQLCLEAGMNDCVTKPLEIEVLLDKIRLLVNTYK